MKKNMHCNFCSVEGMPQKQRQAANCILPLRLKFSCYLSLIVRYCTCCCSSREGQSGCKWQQSKQRRASSTMRQTLPLIWFQLHVYPDLHLKFFKFSSIYVFLVKCLKTHNWVLLQGPGWRHAAGKTSCVLVCFQVECHSIQHYYISPREIVVVQSLPSQEVHNHTSKHLRHIVFSSLPQESL